MKKVGLILLLLLTSNTYSETINEYNLPPEPDPKINNSTLLGIDSNDNGIRDDVERYIIIKEAKNPNFPKTWTAITLQFASAWQKIIEDPTLDNRVFLEKASACRKYFTRKHTKGKGFIYHRQWKKEHSSLLGVDLEDMIFNTKERLQQRFKFNQACSGNIFDGQKESIENCQTNIDLLGE